MNTGIIYKITNIINNKIYIGQTIQKLELRFADHRYSALNTNRPQYLYKAMRKYGIENFKIESIETNIPLYLLNEREQHYIKTFNTIDHSKGYNLTTGGNNGFKMLQDTCENSRKRMLGHKMSDETKQKISDTKKKYPWICTQEYREKQRILSSGRIHSKAGIDRRANKLRGQHRTDEQKQRMRLSALGRKNTPEQCKKISLSLMGRNNKPFIMFKDEIYLGEFQNIQEFCSKYDLNNVSTSKILRGLIQSAKGYSGHRVDKITQTSTILTK